MSHQEFDKDSSQKPISVVQVTSSIFGEAEGTTFAVKGLCSSLADRGLALDLHTLNPIPKIENKDFRLIGYPNSGFPKKLGFSEQMRIALTTASLDADLIHNHGLWMLPNIYSGMSAVRARKPLMLSVHGMLAPAALKRSRLKKKIFSWVWQKSCLESVTCFHATSQEEYLDIRRLGFTQPVSIVPLGVEVPPAVTNASSARKRLLFLGRIHPIKRIDLLLKAWHGIEKAYPNWDLVVCGPDSDGYLAELQQLVTRVGIERVRFLEPVYGSSKEHLLAQSDLLVLPSFTENFGVVVAESLAHGVPAIVTNTAPWAGLEQHGCGWWIEVRQDSLAACLREALAVDDKELSAMGRRGREWMMRDFSWGNVAKMMDITYQWLLGRTERPDWVLLD